MKRKLKPNCCHPIRLRSQTEMIFEVERARRNDDLGLVAVITESIAVTVVNEQHPDLVAAHLQRHLKLHPGFFGLF